MCIRDRSAATHSPRSHYAGPVVTTLCKSLQGGWTMSYAQLFKLLIPELIVLLAGLLLLALDLGVLRNKILVARVRIAAFIACLGLVAAFLWIIGAQTSGRIAV